MTGTIQPTLIVYSHGRTPPLQPPPDLKYDLRDIPNPPRALRYVSDGRSVRLREHLLSDPVFVSRLDRVEREIRDAMKTKLQEHAARKSDQNGSNNRSHHSNVAEVDDDLDEAEAGQPTEVLLRVGCNCALGHHRSVAFVCELAARAWPKDWVVEVVHRDLDKKRSGNARTRQKASWKDDRSKKAGLELGDELLD